MPRGLTFDADSHRYWYDGLPIPNVTSVLEAMSGYGMVPGPVLERAALRGTAVHTACHYYNQGDLEWDSLDSEILDYTMGYIRFLQDTRFEVHYSEERVFSRTLRYAGTLDLAGRFPLNGRRALGDIKTTAELHPVVALQTAAYSNPLNERLKARERYTHRFTLQLTRDGDYNIEWHPEAHDYQRFAACLTLYQWRMQHDEQHPE